MSKYPQIKIASDKKTELYNLVSIGSRISSNFYQEANYYVLPYQIGQNIRVIYFPWMPIFNEPLFWSLGPYYYHQIESSYKKDFEKLLSQFIFEPISNFSQEESIIKIFPKFFEIITDIFPLFYKETREILIIPTRYGSIASESSSQSKISDKSSFYIRTDCPIQHIFYILLMEQINRLPSYKTYTGTERMSLCEHIFKYSKLSDIFPDFEPILPQLKGEIDHKLDGESKRYQEQFGIKSSDIFTVNNNTIFAYEKPIMFTKQERAVMTKFIQTSPTIVSIEDIALAIWGEDSDNKFSLYSINQCISMIRKKLKKNGLSPKLIETFRNQGYRLIN